MFGLELFLMAFLELIEYNTNDGKFAYETLVAYANETDLAGEQREDFFLYMRELNKIYAAHMSKKKEAADKIAAAKAKRDASKAKRGK